MTFLEEVYLKRKPLADVLGDEEYSGIRKIVEELYPDKAHFIYELLQNAEDTGATTVTFSLYEDKLTFEHNGKPFSEEDVSGITNIGKGTKGDDEETIGTFGVGFKAVFAYTETPRIWSPTFAFEISELVLPLKLTAKPEIGHNTRFEFPFNSPKKSAGDAYAEILDGFSELSETTLLFLAHIESINWELSGRFMGEILRIPHSEHHIEVLKQTENKTTASSHFLRFTAPIEGMGKQCIAIAFALEALPKVKESTSSKKLSDCFKIVPATPGRVAISFPAEKETSGLRFHLHAPFIPELSRASIKETPANQPLFEQLEGLTTASLHKIRELGLLTMEFLGVLPNAQEAIPTRYQGIMSAITREMNEQELTPTYARSYAPARRLVQGRARLKDLLSDADLEFLIDYENEPPLWGMAAPQKNSNSDRFLSGLAISDWSINEFVALLNDKASETSLSKPDGSFINWLGSKPVEWHQQFYALLHKEADALIKQYRLKYAKIIRLSTGFYSRGDNCFFPSEDVEHDNVLPRVEIGVYSSGKNKDQQDSSREFLEAVGVREVGEAEQVEAILKKRYTREAVKPDKKIHWGDIKRFVELVKKQPETASIFSQYFIFECSGDLWVKPGSTYLDKPFFDTGLHAYYEALGNDAKSFSLSEKYSRCEVSKEEITFFAKTIGVKTSLKIQMGNCFENPEVSYLCWQAPGRRTQYSESEDYFIEHLDDIINNKSIELSLLIWKSLANCNIWWTVARYCANASEPHRTAPSRLAALLTEAEWIPQDDGTFVTPAVALRSMLPKGFIFDKGWEWLSHIHFGEREIEDEKTDNLQTEKIEKEATLAKELGFQDSQSLDDARWFAHLDLEERQQLRREHQSRPQTELPDHEPANPERRASRVREQAKGAPTRETELRTRSVSMGREAVKRDTDPYLCQQYTNDDGEMICQICKSELPFKLTDKSYYFEAVEFLPELRMRYYQNYLTLCPNHAAMFRHANSTRELMMELFLDINGNKLEAVLAENDIMIYFTKVHIADLRTVIEEDKQVLVDEVEADN